MRKKTEPAFPMVFNDNSWHEGISIRDYFAAKAMQGALSNSARDYDHNGYAEFAYKIADAMLKAREE